MFLYHKFVHMMILCDMSFARLLIISNPMADNMHKIF